jgi:hypothetical protein
MECLEPYSSMLNSWRLQYGSGSFMKCCSFSKYFTKSLSKFEIGDTWSIKSFVLNCTYNWLRVKKRIRIIGFLIARSLWPGSIIPFLLSPTDPVTGDCDAVSNSEIL